MFQHGVGKMKMNHINRFASIKGPERIRTLLVQEKLWSSLQLQEH